MLAAQRAREIIRGGGRTRPRRSRREARTLRARAARGARTPRGNDGPSEDVSWAVDESGAKDDEFVVDAALEADGVDDMETFEEELENAPIDPEAVKMEVNALQKESEMPIERLMQLYRVPPSEQKPSEAAKDSDSDDDSSRDSGGSESRSESDSETGREDEDAAGHLPAFKSEAPEGNPRRRSLTVAGMERPEPSSRRSAHLQ